MTSPIGDAKNALVRLHFTKTIEGYLSVSPHTTASINFPNQKVSIDCGILTDPPVIVTCSDRWLDLLKYRTIKGTVEVIDKKGEIVDKELCLRIEKSFFASKKNKAAAKLLEKLIPSTQAVTTWSDEDVVGEVRARLYLQIGKDPKNDPSTAVKVYTLLGKKVLIFKEGNVPDVLDMPSGSQNKFIAKGGNNTIYLQSISHAAKKQPIALRLNSTNRDAETYSKNTLKPHIYNLLRPYKEFAIPSVVIYKTLKPRMKYVEILSYYNQGTLSLYRNNLKNRDFGKEDPQNLHSERGTIAERQGPSENANSEVNPTWPKTDSSSYFGINSFSSFKEIEDATKQMLEAVKIMHANNIIHRDIKPSNFLVHQNNDGTKTIALADFDTAVIGNAFAEYDVDRGQGTWLYLSPEELKTIGSRVTISTKTDAWALGLTLYELKNQYLPPHIQAIENSVDAKTITIPEATQQLDTVLNGPVHRQWWLEKLGALQLTSPEGQFNRAILLLINPDPKERISAQTALKLINGEL